MKKLLYFLAVFFGIISLIGLFTIDRLDRTAYRNQPHYRQMMQKLDSMPAFSNNRSELKVGFSKISITPDSTMELAGYGARNPKAFEAILDSVFIRSIVLKNEISKAVIVSADLLIIHPLMRDALYSQLKKTEWKQDEVFLTATHTHSSIGEWAPGFVGGLFSGDYDPLVAQIIAERIFDSILEAESKMIPASFSFSESQEEDLVHNRLVQEKGIEDPFLKTLSFKTDEGKIIFSAFSAHPTSLTMNSRVLSGDFPSHFHKSLSEDTSILFSQYAAGPVGSMAPFHAVDNNDELKRYKSYGSELSSRIKYLNQNDQLVSIQSYRTELLLGSPQFKITKNLVLKPYLFYKAFGNDKSEISALKINDLLIVGTPCDFSGELAMPLYEYAESIGLKLMISSFNGGYVGYITDDQWYDLEKNETRTMNWFGPGNGAYFTEIIKRIIDVAGAD